MMTLLVLENTEEVRIQIEPAAVHEAVTFLLTYLERVNYGTV